MRGQPQTAIAFRAAEPGDFDYCAKLYFDGMGEIIRKLQLNMATQIAGFRNGWDCSQVRIIIVDGSDVGWMQSIMQDGALFLAQLYVDATARRQGIGTEVINRLIAEAARSGLAGTLGVVKINPALRLYRRLSFQITHEDVYKFYMRHEQEPVAPISG